MSSSAVSACVTCDSYSCTQVHDVNGMVKSSALGLLDNTDIPGKLVNCLKFGPNSGKTIAIKNVIEHLAAQEECSDRIAIRFRDLNALSTFRSFFPSCENDVVRHPNGLHIRFATRIDSNAVDSYHLVIHDDTSPESDSFTTKSNELYVYTPRSHSTSLSNNTKRKHEDTKDDILLSSTWRIRTKDDDKTYINEYYSDRIRAEHALCTWILEDLELNDWSHEDVLDVGRYFEFSAFNGSSMRVIKKYRNDVKVMQEIAHELLPDEKYQIDKITIQGTKRVQSTNNDTEPSSESTRKRKHEDDNTKICQQLKSRIDELNPRIDELEARLNESENKVTQLKAEIAELRTIKDKQVLDKYDIECE